MATSQLPCSQAPLGNTRPEALLPVYGSCVTGQLIEAELRGLRSQAELGTEESNSIHKHKLIAVQQDKAHFGERSRLRRNVRGAQVELVIGGVPVFDEVESRAGQFSDVGKDERV